MQSDLCSGVSACAGRKLAALDSHYVLLTGGFTGAGDTVARAFYEARIKKHEACVNTDADGAILVYILITLDS